MTNLQHDVLDEEEQEEGGVNDSDFMPCAIRQVNVHCMLVNLIYRKCKNCSHCDMPTMLSKVTLHFAINFLSLLLVTASSWKFTRPRGTTLPFSQQAMLLCHKDKFFHKQQVQGQINTLTRTSTVAAAVWYNSKAIKSPIMRTIYVAQRVKYTRTYSIFDPLYSVYHFSNLSVCY